MGLKTYFTFALAALCSQAVVACDDPEPGDGELAAPNITSISFSGNGCPQGTMNQNTTSLDNLVLGNFSTEVASTVSPIEKTKNCQLHINFSGDNPPDYQFSVKDLILKGYLILESGAAATVYVTTYWSQDAGKTVSMRREEGGRPLTPVREFLLNYILRRRPSRALRTTTRNYPGRDLSRLKQPATTYGRHAIQSPPGS